MCCIFLLPDGAVLYFFLKMEFSTLSQAVWFKAGGGEALRAAWAGPAGTGCLCWAGGCSLKNHTRSHKLEQPFNCCSLLWLRSAMTRELWS